MAKRAIGFGHARYKSPSLLVLSTISPPALLGISLSNGNAFYLNDREFYFFMLGFQVLANC